MRSVTLKYTPESVLRLLKTMNTNNNENGNSEIPEVEDFIIEDGDDTETIQTKVEEYKTKVDERNAQLFARLKKAEGFELKDGKWVKQPKEVKKEDEKTEVKTTESSKDGLSSMDVITIVKNNIPEEDIEEIVEYAKFKKLSLADALKDNVVKGILADKAEQRRVAEGTDTGGGRRGSSKLSDDALLSNARKGIMPESDEDMRRLSVIQRANR